MHAKNGKRAPPALALAAAALIALGAPAAQAEIVAFRVDGTITSVNDPTGLALLPVAVGDAYSIFYTFDTDAPGLPTRIPDHTMSYAQAVLAVSIRIAGNEYQVPHVGGDILISDNQNDHPIFTPFVDRYHVQIGNSVILDHPTFLLNLTLTQAENGTQPTALTSTALTATPPDVALFSERTMALQWFDLDTNRNAVINGTLDAITPVAPVPLPASLWLLGSALLGGRKLLRRR